MKNNEKRDRFLQDKLDMPEFIIKLLDDAEGSLDQMFDKVGSICEYNQYKILKAFSDNRISDSHFAWNTGYGYDDAGRDALERVYADVFGTEKALVRTNMVSGTHALAISFLGILRPGDTLIYATGAPYDTLEETIGLVGDGMGSLKDYGVNYIQVDLTDSGDFDYPAIKNVLEETKGSGTRMLAIQRSPGYSWRNSFTVNQIGELANRIHRIDPSVIVMVDNSYGEFVSYEEPVSLGADIMAGSLIKNSGGGLALSGGYVAGRRDLVDLVSYRLTCPGIGGECGLSFGQTRSMLQGLFLAPQTVSSAVKGAILCGKVYQMLGYRVLPDPSEERSDIVEVLRLGSPEALVAFCRGIQEASPVDSFVSPIPSAMPGYQEEVIMAAGTFVQGASIELSADAPLKEPYNVFFQGALTYPHAKFGIMKSIKALYDKGLLRGYEGK